MNIAKDNFFDINPKKAYKAPSMELIVMDHHMDLLNGSPNEPSSGEDSPETIGVEEE